MGLRSVGPRLTPVLTPIVRLMAQGLDRELRSERTMAESVPEVSLNLVLEV